MSDANQLIQASSDSIFSPESLADIACRLSFIEASECNCVEGPHENALHDLARDDVPVLLKAVDRLDAELKTTRAQLRQVARQIGLFLEDGERNRVIVALAITDGTPEENR